VLLELERRGIVSSSGSACAAGSDEASHVLVALGLEEEVAQTAVRFSWSPDVSAAQLQDVAVAVAVAVAEVGSLKSGR
jgi:cysteine desulfurase